LRANSNPHSTYRSTEIKLTYRSVEVSYEPRRGQRNAPGLSDDGRTVSMLATFGVLLPSRFTGSIAATRTSPRSPVEAISAALSHVVRAVCCRMAG